MRSGDEGRDADEGRDVVEVRDCSRGRCRASPAAAVRVRGRAGRVAASCPGRRGVSDVDRRGAVARSVRGFDAVRRGAAVVVDFVAASCPGRRRGASDVDRRGVSGADRRGAVARSVRGFDAVRRGAAVVDSVVAFVAADFAAVGFVADERLRGARSRPAVADAVGLFAVPDDGAARRGRSVVLVELPRSAALVAVRPGLPDAVRPPLSPRAPMRKAYPSCGPGKPADRGECTRAECAQRRYRTQR
ncbi:hypothetical protein N505_0102875 [Rhodococcus aetherivorans]|nr:hypothetical protein N505_0102875 [Rhodococcus aetherivorans]